MNRFSARFLSALLTAAMLLSLAPLAGLADDTAPEAPTVTINKTVNNPDGVPDNIYFVRIQNPLGSDSYFTYAYSPNLYHHEQVLAFLENNGFDFSDIAAENEYKTYFKCDFDAAADADTLDWADIDAVLASDAFKSAYYTYSVPAEPATDDVVLEQSERIEYAYENGKIVQKRTIDRLVHHTEMYEIICDLTEPTTSLRWNGARPTAADDDGGVSFDLRYKHVTDAYYHSENDIQMAYVLEYDDGVDIEAFLDEYQIIRSDDIFYIPSEATLPYEGTAVRVLAKANFTPAPEYTEADGIYTASGTTSVSAAFSGAGAHNVAVVWYSTFENAGSPFSGWVVRSLTTTITLPGDDEDDTPPAPNYNWSYSAPAATPTPTPDDEEITDEEVPLAEPDDIWSNPFIDVDEDDWFYDDVRYTHIRGLMLGTASDRYSPDATLTRGMAVTALYRASGRPDTGGLRNPFYDVADGKYYTDAVKWAAANNIVVGTGTGAFAPESPITRQDLAVVLNRYADCIGLTLPATQSYTAPRDESDIADYAKESIEKFFKAMVVELGSDGLMTPKAPATRAEATAMLHRFLEASEQ
jgi:hypothetical protein